MGLKTDEDDREDNSALDGWISISSAIQLMVNQSDIPTLAPEVTRPIAMPRRVVNCVETNDKAGT
jgi:hypothetical protein